MVPPRDVLIVIDMQQDYDLSANVALYGEVRSPYANDIAPLVPRINQLRQAVEWDCVVWTLDWLPAAMQRSFCRAHTPGAGLLPGLDFREGQDVVFKKDSDDSFCDIGGMPEAHTGCSKLRLLHLVPWNPTTPWIWRTTARRHIYTPHFAVPLRSRLVWCRYTLGGARVARTRASN